MGASLTGSSQPSACPGAASLPGCEPAPSSASGTRFQCAPGGGEAGSPASAGRPGGSRPAPPPSGVEQLSVRAPRPRKWERELQLAARRLPTFGWFRAPGPGPPAAPCGSPAPSAGGVWRPPRTRGCSQSCGGSLSCTPKERVPLIAHEGSRREGPACVTESLAGSSPVGKRPTARGRGAVSEPQAAPR